MRNTYTLQCFGDSALAFTGGDPPIDKSPLDVLGNIQIVDQVETLEDKPNRASTQDGELLLGGAGHSFAEERVDAARWTVEESQNIEQGRFAAARGTHDGQEFPGRDFK